MDSPGVLTLDVSAHSFKHLVGRLKHIIPFSKKALKAEGLEVQIIHVVYKYHTTNWIKGFLLGRHQVQNCFSCWETWWMVYCINRKWKWTWSCNSGSEEIGVFYFPYVVYLRMCSLDFFEKIFLSSSEEKRFEISPAWFAYRISKKTEVSLSRWVVVLLTCIRPTVCSKDH